ncbi:MAG: NnrS family protein [Sulfurimonas sp.]|nr:NnrS family protein [Sulfurimonas sp.]
MNTTHKQSYFLSQPHQPFFILGLANAIIMMLVFALSYKGIVSLEIASVTFHAYSLLFTVFSNLFLGFLFTTFPRFCQTQVIERAFYTKIFYANSFASLLFIFGSMTSHTVVLLAMAVLFISQIYAIKQLTHIFSTGQAQDKTDPFWILVAHYFGLLSSLLFFLFELGVELQMLAINTGFYMYIIFLTFSVAQRMIPFFSHSYEPKSQNLIIIVFALLLAKTILSSFTLAQIVIDMILALYLLREFMSWKLPLFSSPAILWVLHLGLFWLPMAFFISALAHTLEFFFALDFYFLGIHLLALGFVTTILVGFGTRVILGHSGQSPHADALATKIFWFVQVVVLLRALYSLNLAFGWGADFLFDISLSAWLLLFIIWAARYLKVLVFGYQQ